MSDDHKPEFSFPDIPFIDPALAAAMETMLLQIAAWRAAEDRRSRIRENAARLMARRGTHGIEQALLEAIQIETIADQMEAEGRRPRPEWPPCTCGHAIADHKDRRPAACTVADCECPQYMEGAPIPRSLGPTGRRPT